MNALFLSRLLNSSFTPWKEKIAAEIFLRGETIEHYGIADPTRDEIVELLREIDQLPVEWAREVCHEVLCSQ